MSVKDITQGDFKYFSERAQDMEVCWEKEFRRRMNPDLLRAMYQGRNKALNKLTENEYNSSTSNLTLSRVFSATNTIGAKLYPYNPQPIVTPKRGTTYEQAGLMSAALRNSMEVNKAKQENKTAGLNAWFFGLGWKKVNYRVEYPAKDILSQEPESMTDKIMNMFKGVTGGSEPIPMESKETPDLAYDEGISNTSESPMNVMLDDKTDLQNGRLRLHRLPRTIYDLMMYGNYDEEGLKEAYEKLKRVKGTRFDSRSMDVVLKELHIKQKNGIYVLSWIDGFERPLQYERTVLSSTKSYKNNEFQLVPLCFTYEPGVRYPVSHMKVMCQVQEKIDKLASLFIDIVGRTRNMTILNRSDLDKGSIDAIEQNTIGSLILTNKPVNQGTFAQLTSAAVSNDIPTLLSICQQNLTEIAGADEQLVSGNSKNDTLGQDELARIGTKVRESGMQDSMRDFMIKQMHMEGCLLQEYSEGKLQLSIKPEDYANPQMQLESKPQDVEFMTERNPVALKSMLQGNYPGGSGVGEYDYDMNVEDAIRPDNEVLSRKYIELIREYSNPLIKEALLNSPKPKRVRVDLLIEEHLKCQQTLGVPQRFMEELDSMQVAAIRTQEMLLKGGAPQKGQASQPKPKEENVAYQA